MVILPLKLLSKLQSYHKLYFIFSLSLTLENMTKRIAPLQTTRCVLTWLYLYPADQNTNKWKKLAYIIVSLIVFIVNVCGLAASVAFFMKFVSTDLEESIYALFQITGILPQIASMLVAFALRQKIFVIFEKLTTIYIECKGNYFKINF